MKRAILPAICLALLLSLPAVSQEEGPTLEQKVADLTKKVEEQGAALKELQAYVDHQKTQAKRLNKSLSNAEEQGFLLPAPNNEAKKSLLDGLHAFADVAGGAEPKKDSDEE
jgi:septal ring factor EnvC (AmiA/AmiB activator)